MISVDLFKALYFFYQQFAICAISTDIIKISENAIVISTGM
jgi:hypothetical protein